MQPCLLQPPCQNRGWAGGNSDHRGLSVPALPSHQKALWVAAGWTMSGEMPSGARQVPRGLEVDTTCDPGSQVLLSRLHTASAGTEKCRHGHVPVGLTDKTHRLRSRRGEVCRACRTPRAGCASVGLGGGAEGRGHLRQEVAEASIRSSGTGFPCTPGCRLSSHARQKQSRLFIHSQRPTRQKDLVFSTATV